MWILVDAVSGVACAYFVKLSINVRNVIPPLLYRSINICSIGLCGVSVNDRGIFSGFLSYLLFRHVSHLLINFWMVNSMLGQ